MVIENYQKALADVQAQIARVIAERTKLDATLAQLQATERGLANLVGQQLQAEASWTDLVRTVMQSLQGQNVSVTAAQVRDILISWGYDLSGFKNPLGFIHTILQRLHERGEIGRSPKGRPFTFGRR